MARNRSAMGISPVGTIIRASEKALAPESSVRVLTAIDARRKSTGAPISMWYREAASAAAVRKAVLSVPPRRLAASLVSRNGAVATSKRRFRLRVVHSGERARSTSESWATTPRTVSIAAVVALGMAAGSASRSRTCLETPSGRRNPPTTRSRMASAAEGDGGAPTGPPSVRSIGGGSGASRSKSRYCSDICTPPSPSVMVWCIFCSSAALPPQPFDDDELPQRSGAVERVERDQRGEIEQLAHGPRLGQGDAADVLIDLEIRGRRPTAARRSSTGVGWTRHPSRGRPPRRAPCRPAADRSRAVGRAPRRCRTSTSDAGPSRGATSALRRRSSSGFVGVGHRPSISHGVYQRCPDRLTTT